MMNVDLDLLPHVIEEAKLLLEFPESDFDGSLADVWEQKLGEEQEKTQPLEQVCAALREDLDAQHKKRMEALEIKMKPIIIRDGPSKKANYKIMAARLHYEIYALTQRLRLTTIRAEHEQARREKREREVKRLRALISEKKTTITTVTKGIPFTKLEVRPTEQQPNYSGPIEATNPLLSGMPNATAMARGIFNETSPLFGSSSIFSLPSLPGIGGPSNAIGMNTFGSSGMQQRVAGQSSFLPPATASSSHNSSIPSSAAAVAEAAGGLARKAADQLPNGRPPQAIQTT